VREFMPVTVRWKVYDEGEGMEAAVRKAREIARACRDPLHARPETGGEVEASVRRWCERCEKPMVYRGKTTDWYDRATLRTWWWCGSKECPVRGVELDGV
jgi:hypothetical protein